MNFSKFSFVVCFLMLSCTSVPKKNPPVVASVNAKNELAQIQIEIAAGGIKRATQRLKTLIGQHPKSDVADDATMSLANLYYRQNNFENAYNTYMSLVESDVFSPNEAEALLGAIRSLHKLGRLEEALALTSRGSKIPGLSDGSKVEFYRQRYELLSALGDRVDALSALSFLYAKEPRPEVKTQLLGRAHNLVSALPTEADLEKVANDRQFEFVGALAAFRLGQMKMKAKDYDGARQLFARAISLGAEAPIQSQAQGYLDQIEARRKVEPYTIGAVLPITGRYAPIAYKTLRGLQMGLGIYGPDRSSFKLAVMDSEGSPEMARKAVERLIMEDSVIALVGDVLSRTAVTVAMKAEELGVPSFALSQKSGLTETGTYIFRNAVTSQMQMRELVRIAMEDLGQRRFAILYPNEGYGVEYANLFWDEVLARGGIITGAQAYSPQETDFRGPIRRLVGTYYMDDRRTEYQNRVRDWFKKQKSLRTRATPPDDLLPPIVDFDALFIPDGPKAIGQIGPMLAYQGINGVRLLGTNAWNTSELTRRGQRTVENSIFIDSNLANDPSFKESKFFKDFVRTFGEEPGLFEAQGYEVGQILRQAISGGERSRVGLAQTLSSLRQFQGVSGLISMTPTREMVRPLTPFVVKDSQILAWSPQVELSAPAPGTSSGKKSLSK